jgi:hypothetical protein
MERVLDFCFEEVHGHWPWQPQSQCFACWKATKSQAEWAAILEKFKRGEPMTLSDDGQQDVISQ